VALDHATAYRVIQARDARYDGRLFVGVKTTGIYCRPICPVRTPAAKNVIFFPSAAAAHEAGFRPCLRCRPEVAPDLAAWNGTSSTVARALRLIESDSTDTETIDSLAARLGIGARQLNRLFAQHVGASPGSVMRTRRIHLARQLLQDTDLPIADVAFAAGFSSLRRFNETFKDMFGRPPRELRRRHSPELSCDVARGFAVRLSYSPPYAWTEMLSFLARRATPGVESVSNARYVRSIVVGSQRGVIAVERGKPGELLLRVHCRRLDALRAIVARVRGMFDLHADPRIVDAHLSADPWLAPLVDARPGLRVAGAWDGFELAVRAVLGQQITVRAATALAGKLVSACGEPIDMKLRTLYPGITSVFPAPASFDEKTVRRLGMPGARAAALIALARRVEGDPTLLGQRSSLDDSIRSLTTIPGVGDWTAQYIAMRELREPDAFPSTDVALLRAAETLAGRRLTAADLVARAERWRPWRAYAALHLWATLAKNADASMDSQVA